MMGLLPFLLVIYLLLQEHFDFTERIILSGALILFSILSGFVLLRHSADQLTMLAQETGNRLAEKIPAALELQVDDELGDIAAHFNAMVERLSSAHHDIQAQSVQLLQYARDLSFSYEKLRQEEEVRYRLCRYISKDVVEQLLDVRNDFLLENRRTPVTVMFVDIRGFTSIAEHMESEEVVAMLNRYFEAMVEIVFRHHGLLDKFVGDQLMAVFGHISSEIEGARDAVNAALEMQSTMNNLMEQDEWQHWPRFAIGIGINTGPAIIGNVGSSNRMDYTVIGDMVNTAARLEKQANGGEICIGERTRRHLPSRIRVSEQKEIRLRNRLQPVICCNVLG